jgi:hypothetical protein
MIIALLIKAVKMVKGVKGALVPLAPMAYVIIAYKYTNIYM